MTPTEELAQWVAAEEKLVKDLTGWTADDEVIPPDPAIPVDPDNPPQPTIIPAKRLTHTVGSYSVAGRSYSYRGLAELRAQLRFVRDQISRLRGQGGGFTLAQMGGL